MTDQTNNETEAPWAPGLDDLWWRAASNAAVDSKEAEDFHQFRLTRYLMSEGREQHGGWAAPSGGRLMDWGRM
jgi:hypothetical protein